MLDVADFTTNPAVPRVGPVRHVGGALRQSDARVTPAAAAGRHGDAMGAEVVEEYVTDVRPCYAASAHPALFLTERGERISTTPGRRAIRRLPGWLRACQTISRRTACGTPTFRTSSKTV